MLKYIVAFILLSTVAQAQTIIGFRGKNGAFDERAFVEYATKKNASGVILYADQIDYAIKQIKNTDSYELYGYSLGAVSVGQVLRIVQNQRLLKPEFVLTVGAYRTTDVNFTKYKIEYQNYFDISGLGQKSPGIFLKSVNHGNIMRYVTDNLVLN